MPELPEVETIRRGLVRLLPDRKIVDVEHNWQKSFPNDDQMVRQFFIGTKVVDVRRRAKVLLIDLNSKYSLVIHLKMTGQLVFRSKDTQFGAGHPNDSLVGELPDTSTRVTISFADKSKLFFNDQRKFGWIKLMPTVEVENIDFFKKVGPEPLDKSFAPKVFIERIRRRSNTTIKAALLDQTVLAGVGNIYADESLWSAQIHPATKVKDASDKSLCALHTALIAVLKLSIKKGGSTDRNYIDAEGRRGSYLSFANVFRRQGKPCTRCKTKILKTRVAGRGTHYCPFCQKIFKDIKKY